MHPIVLLLFAHFLGDFVFQGNKIASSKSKSLKWLTIHVGIYVLMLIIPAYLIFKPEIILDFLVVNGVLHWITDFFTSKINARLFLRKNKHLFYIGIGIDQFIHAACLIYTYEYYISLGPFPNLFEFIFR